MHLHFMGPLNNVFKLNHVVETGLRALFGITLLFCYLITIFHDENVMSQGHAKNLMLKITSFVKCIKHIQK